MRSDFIQLSYLHHKLRELLSWLETSTGLEFTQTSSYRLGKGSVHNTIPCRGFDLRMRDKKIGKALVDHINKRWKYDPTRPDLECAILHGEGANLHIHIQVHKNTTSNV